MTGPVPPLEPHERAAAVAFLEVVHGFENIESSPYDLEALNDQDHTALVLLVRRMLAAAKDEAPKPRRRGPLNELDAEALRLDLPDARAVLVLAKDTRDVVLGAFSDRSRGSMGVGPDVAGHLWAKVLGTGATHATHPASPPSTEQLS